MMRAALILAGIGTLVAMELGTPARLAKAVNQPRDAQSTAGIGDLRDTLTKADRLEIPYFQNELPAQQLSFVERTPSAVAAPGIAKEAPKSVSGNRPEAKARKVAVIGPKPKPKSLASIPRPKTTDSRTIANTDRSKAPVNAKPCRENAFDSLLKALNLSSGCET